MEHCRETQMLHFQSLLVHLSGVSSEGALQIRKKNLTQDREKYSHWPQSPMHRTEGLHTVGCRLISRAESADNLSSFLPTKASSLKQTDVKDILQMCLYVTVVDVPNPCLLLYQLTQI